MAGIQDAFELTSSLKCKPPTVMAGIQDALQLSGTTSVYVIGEQEGGGGGNRSSDVSHAAGPPTRTTKEGLMGATTPPQGNQRDNNEGHRKDKYYIREQPSTYTYTKDEEERFTRGELMRLDRMNVLAATTYAESIREANAEARAEYDRARAEANRARAKAEAVLSTLLCIAPQQR